MDFYDCRKQGIQLLRTWLLHPVHKVYSGSKNTGDKYFFLWAFCFISFNPCWKTPFFSILTQPENTALLRINQSEAVLWSKIRIFKRAFHSLRILPQLCLPQNFWQLMRASKWGTLKGFPSRDIRMARGQSYRLLTLLNKKSLLKNF